MIPAGGAVAGASRVARGARQLLQLLFDADTLVTEVSGKISSIGNQGTGNQTAGQYASCTMGQSNASWRPTRSAWRNGRQAWQGSDVDTSSPFLCNISNYASWPTINGYGTYFYALDWVNSNNGQWKNPGYIGDPFTPATELVPFYQQGSTMAYREFVGATNNEISFSPAPANGLPTLVVVRFGASGAKVVFWAHGVPKQEVYLPTSGTRSTTSAGSGTFGFMWGAREVSSPSGNPWDGWPGKLAAFGYNQNQLSDSEIQSLLADRASYYDIVPTASAGVNPATIFDLVYDSSGLAGSAGSATTWVPTKGTGTLTDVDANTPWMTSFGGKTAARSLGGRLSNKSSTPSVTPVGNKMTYAIAGVIPDVANGAWAGLTGSSYAGGTKPFPVILENTGGVISWQIGAQPSSTPRDVFIADITSWVGKSFFAIIRQSGTAPDKSRLDIYIDGSKQQYISPTQNITTTSALGGLTLLGFEDSNGNWDAPFAYFGAGGGWLSDAQVSSILDWAIEEYHLAPTAVDPMATLSLVYDSAGISGSAGSPGTTWVPSKGTGTLGEIDPGAPVVTVLGAKKALRSNGGRLAIRGATPAVAPSSNKITYVFAGVIPTIGVGSHAGCSGSASAYGGSKAFPLAIENSGGTVRWRWANVEGGTADNIPYNLAPFVGQRFFAVQRCLGSSGTVEYSKLDIYINGARRHFEATTRNITSIGNLGGLTLLGFEELNGDWNSSFAYFGAMPGWPTDIQTDNWLEWARAEYDLDSKLHTHLYMSNAERVVSGSPLRFDSIPNPGTAGGTWTYRGAGAARPALQNWDDLTNVSAYFDNDSAGFLPPGSQPASSWSFLGPSSLDAVDATIALRYYDIGGAGAGMLYTASSTSDNGIRLSVQGGQLQFLVATPSSDDGTISMGAATSGLFNDLVIVKSNAASGTPTFSAYRATNDGVLSAVGTPVNVANHSSNASLTLNFGGLTTYRAIYAELRIYRGLAANATQRDAIVAAMRSLYPVTP